MRKRTTKELLIELNKHGQQAAAADALGISRERMRQLIANRKISIKKTYHVEDEDDEK